MSSSCVHALLHTLLATTSAGTARPPSRLRIVGRPLRAPDDDGERAVVVREDRDERHAADAAPSRRRGRPAPSACRPRVRTRSPGRRDRTTQASVRCAPSTSAPRPPTRGSPLARRSTTGSADAGTAIADEREAVVQAPDVDVADSGRASVIVADRVDLVRARVVCRAAGTRHGSRATATADGSESTSRNEDADVVDSAPARRRSARSRRARARRPARDRPCARGRRRRPHGVPRSCGSRTCRTQLRSKRRSSFVGSSRHAMPFARAATRGARARRRPATAGRRSRAPARSRRACRRASAAAAPSRPGRRDVCAVRTQRSPRSRSHVARAPRSAPRARPLRSTRTRRRDARARRTARPSAPRDLRTNSASAAESSRMRGRRAATMTSGRPASEMRRARPSRRRRCTRHRSGRPARRRARVSASATRALERRHAGVCSADAGEPAVGLPELVERRRPLRTPPRRRERLGAAVLPHRFAEALPDHVLLALHVDPGERLEEPHQRRTLASRGDRAC